MYLPPRFAGDEKIGLELIQAYPFATLISAVDSVPQIDHLPLVQAEGKLWGHMAHTNPHWKNLSGCAVTAVFHGPHAFIDHNWYSQPELQVPTWNYAVVHVTGEVTLFHDTATLMGLLDKLQAHMAPGPSWAQAAPADLKANIEKGIVGFSIEMRSVQTKLKLSQNRSEQDPHRVMTKLAESPREMDQEVARMMREQVLKEPK